MAKEAFHTVDARESYDALTLKLEQVRALLAMTFGEARDSFNNLEDIQQDHYMWACADMVKDCGDLLAAIPYPAAEVRDVQHQ
jgi:hypothetical protein